MPQRQAGLDPPDRAQQERRHVLRNTPILLLPRSQVGLWSGLIEQTPVSELSPKTQKVHEALSQHGALFFDELIHEAHLLRSELEIALQELVGAGLVNADSFAGLRALITPASKRQNRSSRRGRGRLSAGWTTPGAGRCCDAVPPRLWISNVQRPHPQKPWNTSP